MMCCMSLMAIRLAEWIIADKQEIFFLPSNCLYRVYHSTMSQQWFYLTFAVQLAKQVLLWLAALRLLLLWNHGWLSAVSRGYKKDLPNTSLPSRFRIITKTSSLFCLSCVCSPWGLVFMEATQVGRWTACSAHHCRRPVLTPYFK